MKKNMLLAVLLTALFLAPFSAVHGEAEPAFTVDETRILSGMDRSIRQGYTPAVSGNRWTMILPVCSDTAVGSVTAELLTPAGCTSFFKSGEIRMTAVKEDLDVWGVRFSPAVFPNPKNADYPCVIRLTGRDAKGNTLTTDIPYTIRVRGGSVNVEKAVPVISGIQAELAVGEEGFISITLSNACTAAEMENLELKISDAAGHILPRSAETVSVGDLAIGESVTFSYPVTVVEKASIAPHVVKLDLTWTALGQQMSTTANYTLPVCQEIRLEQGGLKMAPSVAAGDSVSVTLPLMNMGKADIVNTLATVSIPGITDRQSVLVGTIQPGETKQAQLVLSPPRDLEGSFDGEMTVDCTDQDGNPASIRLPLHLTVTAPVQAAPLSGGTEKKQTEIPPAVWILAGSCTLLLLTLLIQGTVLRRKIHLLEEAKL